jgi:hypothetical protein
VSIRDLNIFETAEGKVLEGTIVTSPIVMVGITTFLEDSNGDVIQLGLYNQLSNTRPGYSGIAQAVVMFPKGTRLAIAEPFLKIFHDGRGRGVRVDEPSEVHKLSNSGERSTNGTDPATVRATNHVARCLEEFSV